MKGTFIGFNLDFLGFTTSVACAIHCAFLPFLISALPFMGLSLLENPWFEYGVILVSLLLALLALSHGYLRHHKKSAPIQLVSFGFLIIAIGLLWAPEDWEHFITPLGALLISWAHFLNWQLIKKSKTRFPECQKTNQP